MDTLALAVEIVTALLSASGIAYGLLALWGARDFTRQNQAQNTSLPSPPLSILKPVKGIDPRMYSAFVSHCTQVYAAPFELLFGVSSLEDPAVGEIARLRIEYPDVPVRLIHCPERLGTSGKVSNLIQMLRAAQYEHIVINDADIRVPQGYLSSIGVAFAYPATGLVTAPYIGIAESTLWSRLEALGISTDFMAGVLTARKLEGGIRFGLGSTLAVTRATLASIGGLESLTESLADDYLLGARIAAAGQRVVLLREAVATSVPAYALRGFCEHQLRWARSTRDSRRLGYVGLGVTYVLPWALATFIASGASLWSMTLLSVALLVRVAVALQVGVGILRDGQVIRDIALIPLRDFFGLFFWLWSYAGDTVVWRGETFRLKNGTLERLRPDPL